MNKVILFIIINKIITTRYIKSLFSIIQKYSKHTKFEIPKSSENEEKVTINKDTSELYSLISIKTHSTDKLHFKDFPKKDKKSCTRQPREKK
jgi:hypothetical protein